MTDLLRKYAKALMKGADHVSSGPRHRGGSDVFLRACIERFDEHSTVLVHVDVHKAVPGLVREEMRNRLIVLRDDIDTMIIALAKVKE